MDINKAIQLMKENVKNEYAQGYLASLEDAIEGGTEGLAVQLMYVLENTRGWRGETAREVKAFVRNWIKEKTG